MLVTDVDGFCECILLVCHTVLFCQLYSFGETISIVFWTDTWQPDSFYDKIVCNLERGLHTLCLLGNILHDCL